MKNIAKKTILFFAGILFCLSLSCDEDYSIGDYYFKSQPENYLERTIYPHIDGFPVSSPDGTRIMYYHAGIRTISKDGLVKTDADSAGLWLINVDGTNPHLILKGGLGAEYDWRADGKWIVFEDGGQIYKVPIIGDSIVVSQIQQLTVAGRNFLPAWSPDGEWIAYDRSIADGSGPAGIWMMKADGTHKKVVASGGYPGWSPTGDYLVYIGWIDSTKGGIIKFDLQTENRTLLLDGQNIDMCCPKYSYDGTKIAFQSQSEGEYPQIWVINANGNNLKKLTTTGGFNPCWVDNDKIAYIGFRSRGTNMDEYIKNHGTLWIMNTDGNNKKQLTFFYGEVIAQR